MGWFDAGKKKLNYSSNIELNLLEPLSKIIRVDSEAGRLYILGDKKFKSVTTWLSSFGQESIENWRKAIGEDEAKKISNRAANRGTKLHEVMEFFLKDTSNTYSVDFQTADLLKRLAPILTTRVSNIRLIENQLFSYELKLAGTIDLLADFDGELSTIDLKSSTRPKDKEEIEKYWLQTAAYSFMVEERYNISPKNLVIIMVVEYSSPIVMIESYEKWKKILIDFIEKYPPLEKL